MEKQFDTSFIPQQPLLKVEGSSRFHEATNYPLYIGFIAMFISVSVLGGLYFYKQNVDGRIIALEKELESKEGSLKIEDINRYKSIDQRLTISKKLLSGHVAFSTILELLEKVTAQNIGWTALSYDTKADGFINIKLEGQAPNYSAVYVQAQKWKDLSEGMQSYDIEMPSIAPETGIVQFKASFTVDPGFIKYSKKFSKKEASSDEPQVTETQ